MSKPMTDGAPRSLRSLPARGRGRAWERPGARPDLFDCPQTELGGAHHADDAARRSGEDRVLALERLGIGEAARRLHEVEVHARHLGGDGVDVAAQDRREIGIDHGRVAAAHQLHQRAHLVRHAHLGEAGRARQSLGGELVRGEAPAMHEDDRHARQARGARRLQVGGQHRLVERPHQRAVGADPLVGLDHLGIEQLGQDDVRLEQLRPLLVADAQRIAKAAWW